MFTSHITDPVNTFLPVQILLYMYKRTVSQSLHQSYGIAAPQIPRNHMVEQNDRRSDKLP